MPEVSIFIVEDEFIVAEDIRQILNDLGYAVAGTAGSGEDALSAIEKTHPDLVLMDIHLAGTMDGIDTAGIVRERFGYPVIFLTAHSDDTNISRAKQVGPYGYIIKPFGERELLSTIEMALSRFRLDQITNEKERTIRVLANAIPDPVMLLNRQYEILAANDAMMRRLRGSTALYQEKPVFLPGKNCLSETMKSRIENTFIVQQATRYEEKHGTNWHEITLRPVAGNTPESPLLMVQCHDITDRKHLEQELRAQGLAQIEQNMEQFQILNDQIRNPLQALLGYVNLDCEGNQAQILEQIRRIDDLVRQLDQGWAESEKVRRFLLQHYFRDSLTPLPEEESGETPAPDSPDKTP